MRLRGQAADDYEGLEDVREGGCLEALVVLRGWHECARRPSRCGREDTQPASASSLLMPADAGRSGTYAGGVGCAAEERREVDLALEVRRRHGDERREDQQDGTSATMGVIHRDILGGDRRWP